MSDNLGLGVIIGMLGGNQETVSAIQQSLNKTIKEVKLEGNILEMDFEDGTSLSIFDNGQTCCEHRYMVTADDLRTFAGAKFLNAETVPAPNEPNQYGEHEVQFLNVTTSFGVFQMATHNEHNGYYGGFHLVARFGSKESQ